MKKTEEERESMSDYLSVQFGQLSLAHDATTDKVDHVGLVHLGHRVGSQANFAPRGAHTRVYRAKNRDAYTKILALAFNQRHQAPFRKEKLLKDFRWNRNAGQLIYAGFNPTTQSPTMTDPRDHVIRYLLQELRDERGGGGGESDGPSPPKKFKRDDQLSLESRLNRLEQFFTPAEPSNSNNNNTGAQDGDDKEAAEEEEEEEAQQQQQEEEEDGGGGEEVEEGNKRGEVPRRTTGIPPTADEETRRRLKALEARVEALTKKAATPSLPLPRKRQGTVVRGAPAAAKRETTKRTAPAAAAAIAASQKLANCKLIKAAFDPRDQASEIETIRMSELMPTNSPLAVQLIKDIERDIQEMSPEDREILASLVGEKR